MIDVMTMDRHCFASCCHCRQKKKKSVETPSLLFFVQNFHFGQFWTRFFYFVKFDYINRADQPFISNTLWSDFWGEFNDAIYKPYSEEAYWEMFKNMKYHFRQKCWEFVYKGLTKSVSGVALDRKLSFDLIYAIVKVLIIKAKNAIVWFSMISMRYPSCFGSDFRQCFFQPQKVEQRCHHVTAGWRRLFGADLDA